MVINNDNNINKKLTKILVNRQKKNKVKARNRQAAKRRKRQLKRREGKEDENEDNNGMRRITVRVPHSWTGGAGQHTCFSLPQDSLWIPLTGPHKAPLHIPSSLHSHTWKDRLSYRNGKSSRA